ncbi:unnamed protein product [Symbiodinium sp. CCMP2592]|nr:unnamed protein product [Symbiodinium sp. CCMP2592]
MVPQNYLPVTFVILAVGLCAEVHAGRSVPASLPDHEAAECSKSSVATMHGEFSTLTTPRLATTSSTTMRPPPDERAGDFDPRVLDDGRRVLYHSDLPPYTIQQYHKPCPSTGEPRPTTSCRRCETPHGDQLVEDPRDPASTDPDLDSVNLLSTYMYIWVCAGPTGKAFDYEWNEGDEPAWFEDVIDRVGLDIDRGMEAAEASRAIQRAFTAVRDDRFLRENEGVLNSIHRAIAHYRPITGDAVINGMGHPTDAEVRGRMDWVVDQLMRAWYQRLCPVAYRNMEHENALLAMGWDVYQVIAVEGHYDEEDRERAGLSRSRSPHRRPRMRMGAARQGPQAVAPDTREGDESGLFQDHLGGWQMRWEQLVEAFWCWFEEGRAVGMAICMARNFMYIRGNNLYVEWCSQVLQNLGAAIPNRAGSMSDTSPVDFYEWAREIEDLLFRRYETTVVNEATDTQPASASEANVSGQGGDAVVLMEDRYSHGRRRIRDSHIRFAVNAGLHKHTAPQGLLAPARAKMCAKRALGTMLPDLSQPMSRDTAASVWRHLLFDREHFGPQLSPNGRVADSFLPPSMLQEVSAVHESMSPQNRVISTLALVTVIRYLMAELSMTVNTADAIVEDDDHLLMQQFLLTDGRDTMEKRWGRAMQRMHKELLGMDKGVRLSTIRRFRLGLPPTSLHGQAGQWREQLDALLVALADGEAMGPVCDANTDWVRQWVNEISVFVPGYQFTPYAIDLDTQSSAAAALDRDFDRLLEDEASHRSWKCRQEAEEAEEEARQAAHYRLQEEEALALQADAMAYREWEHDVLHRTLRQQRLPPPKRRCILTVEAATSSGDVPKVAHTLALDVPLSGDPVVLTIRASMEPEPEEVSTQRVDSPDGALLDRPNLSPVTEPATTQPAHTLDIPADMEFHQYEEIYQAWREDRLSLEDVRSKYGNDVAELVVAQAVVSRAEDDSLERLAGKGMAPDTGPAESHSGASGSGDMAATRSPLVEPGAPRPPFGLFENIYGQWRDGLRTDQEILDQFGATWLGCFRQWRVWGLDAIYHKLSGFLEMNNGGQGESVCPPVSHKAGDVPTKVLFSVVRVVYARWRDALIGDGTILEIYGPVWLQLFRDLHENGLDAMRAKLDYYVEWDETSMEPVLTGPVEWVLPRWLQLDGYKAVPLGLKAKEWEKQAQRNERVCGFRAPTGVATLYRSSRFEEAAPAKSGSGSGLLVFLRGVEPLPGGGEGVLELAIGNLHLVGDPDKSSEHLKALNSLKKNFGKQDLRIVCGDFNSECEPTAEVGKWFAEEGLQEVPTGSSWAEPGRSLRLDHIFCSGRIQAFACTGDLSEEEVVGGLPCASQPSDHSPVGALLGATVKTKCPW